MVDQLRPSVVERVRGAFPKAHRHWTSLVQKVEAAVTATPNEDDEQTSLEARQNGWTLNASMLLDEEGCLAVGIDVYSGTRGEHHSAVQFCKDPGCDDLNEDWSVTISLGDPTHSEIIPLHLVEQMQDRFSHGPDPVEQITEFLSGRPVAERNISVSDDEAWQIIDALIQLYKLAPTSIVGSH